MDHITETNFTAGKLKQCIKDLWSVVTVRCPLLEFLLIIPTNVSAISFS